jgi:hypothetical protein
VKRVNGNGSTNGRHHDADTENGRTTTGPGHKANGTSKANPEMPARPSRVGANGGRKGRLARQAEGA